MGARDPLCRPLGDYLLLRRLRSGAMATLHLAVRRGDEAGAAPLAVKLLHPHLVQDASAVELFERESWLTRLMQHPNLVQGRGSGAADGRPYLVLEYVAGPTLERVSERCRERGVPMPVAVARELLRGLCDALHYAHELSDEQGPLAIVHRDVSPANLMVSPQGELKLLDFGLAKTTRLADHARGGLLGTVAYAAPEQLEGQPVDRRADLFSVGVLAFEWLTGQRLFWRGNAAATALAVTEGVVPSPSELRPALSPQLDATLRRALARRPEERYASALELRDAIVCGLGADPGDVRAFVQQLRGRESGRG